MLHKEGENRKQIKFQFRKGDFKKFKQRIVLNIKKTSAYNTLTTLNFDCWYMFRLTKAYLETGPSDVPKRFMSSWDTPSSYPDSSYENESLGDTSSFVLNSS